MIHSETRAYIHTLSELRCNSFKYHFKWHIQLAHWFSGMCASRGDVSRGSAKLIRSLTYLHFVTTCRYWSASNSIRITLKQCTIRPIVSTVQLIKKASRRDSVSLHIYYMKFQHYPPTPPHAKINHNKSCFYFAGFTYQILMGIADVLVPRMRQSKQSPASSSSIGWSVAYC